LATLVRGRNLSLAWLAAVECLLAGNGRDVNLAVTIEHPGDEDPIIRDTLDTLLTERQDSSVATVASTIFPEGLYHPRLGERARQHLYEMYDEGYPVIQRHPSNRFGTYFRRFTAWPGRVGAVNQIERTVQRLRGQLAHKGTLSSVYELGISDPEDDEPAATQLRAYDPGHDTQLRGFPCLSHVSLTLVNRCLHMTALYRNQHFVRKAYGNYVGLSRLLSFLCKEVACDPGELVCVATHADAEISGGGFGRHDLVRMVELCRTGSRTTSGLVAAAV